MRVNHFLTKSVLETVMFPNLRIAFCAGVFLTSAFLATPANIFGAAKELPPAGGTPKAFRLPATEDFTLPNGIRVTLAPYGNLPKVTVRVVVDAGAVNEAANQVWLSKLTAALMKEGTTTRSAEDVARQAADMGGEIDVAAQADQTTIGGDVLSEFGPQFATLVADVVRNPALPASELNRLKDDLARTLAVEKMQPGPQAREKFLQVMYANHPYGRSYPAPDALKALTLADVQSFYKTNFGALRTRIYVAGVIDPGMKKAITDAFGDWGKGTAAVPVPVTPTKSYSLSVIDRKDATQSTLYLGLPMMSPGTKDYIPMQVTDALLGGSFTSRITTNIREDKGYTYSPFSQVATRRNQAYWVEVADVTTAVTGASLKEIFGEVDKLRKEPPSEAELAGTRNYMAGIFVLRNSSRAGVIGQLSFVDLQGLQRAYLANYVPNVLAVKPQDVQRIAESYLTPSKMTLVVVGDRAKIDEQLKPYEKK